MGYAQWYLSALAPTSPCGTIDSKTAQRHDDGHGAHSAVDQRRLTDKRKKMSGAARCGAAYLESVTGAFFYVARFASFVRSCTSAESRKAVL